MKCSLLFVLSFITLCSFAQPGEVDLTFNTADKGNRFGEGTDLAVLRVLALPDGKAIIGGTFSSYNGVRVNRIARLNADGTVDQSFSTGTGFQSGAVTALARDADGKLLVGGDFSTYNGVVAQGIVRINANGSIDNTFNNGVAAAAQGVNDIIVQADGKIVIAGTFSLYKTISRKGIARINADGTLDTSFDPGTGIAENVNGSGGTILAIRQDAAGKTIAVGRFTFYNGTAIKHIVRINTNGQLDATLNTGTGPDNTVNDVDIQTDGKIFIGGKFKNYNGTARNYIARISDLGTLDTQFQPLDAANDEVTVLRILSDGKIAIAGYFSEYETLTRLKFAVINANGVPSSTLQTGTGFASSTNTASVNSFDVMPDGKFIVSGTFNLYQDKPAGYIARINANGDYDASFAVSAASPLFGAVNKMVVQPDGKIIVVGNFVFYGTALRKRIVRINADGSIDNTFNPGIAANGNIHALALQSDGKILIGGTFSTFNSVNAFRIARLNADGTRDATFTAQGTGTVYDIAIQTDGKIVVVGQFDQFNAVTKVGIVRLTSTGANDAAFTAAASANANIQKVTIQPDQKILVGGVFATLNGLSRANVGRLNADGTTDTNFNTPKAANSTVRAITVLSSGKIAIGGEFSNYNDVIRRGVAILNSDFSLDTSFDPTNTAPNTAFRNAIVQVGQKLIIAGNVNHVVNGKVFSGIARYNLDGTLDETFMPFPGANGTVNSVLVLSDGKYLIGGSFDNVAGVGRNYIARLYSECAGNVIVDKPTLVASDDHLCVNEVVKLSVTVGTLPPQADWKWYKGTVGGVPVGTGTFINTSAGTVAGPTTYFARAEGGCVTPGEATSMITTAIKPVVTTTNAIRCGDGDVTLTATTTSGIIKWYWRQDGQQKATGTSFTFEVRSFVIYDVQADDGGCLSDKVEATAESKFGGSLVITDNGQGTLGISTTASSPIESFKSFQWETCAGVKVAGATGVTFPVTTTGSYRVTGISQFDCPIVSACRTVTIVVGLEEAGLFSAFPNPSSGAFNIDLGTEVYSSIVIHDINGKQFYSESGRFSGVKKIDMNASRGVYIVSLQGATLRKVKLVID